MAPFSSSAAEVSLEFDDRTAESRGTGRYDVKNEVTRIGGRVLVKVSRSIAVNNVRVEFVGEETVYQRGWTSLGSSVSREIVRQRSTVHAGGTLAEGVHVFGFSIEVPGWVPSTVDRELCRIKYVVRGVVERSSLGTYLMGSQGGMGGGGGGGVGWVKEEEVECRRVRVARRLARRKKIDQSVGCPDGSCHVRFWGSVSRDVVKPGAQIKIDVVARTSDARYGLRLLVANLAEHVLCHVQARGEERLTKKITNLVSCRLDGLGDSNSNSSSIEAARPEEAGSWGSRESPGARDNNNNNNNNNNSVDDGDARGLLQLPRGVRKTRSRLAVLLRNTSPSRSLSRMASAQSTGAVNECDYSTARAQRSPPPLPQTPSAPAARSVSVSGAARPAQRPPSVVRQIRASHVIQVPYGLSQFSSEYVSREYRLMLVAEVAPLDDWEINGNSVHTCDSARPAVAPYDAPVPMPPPLLLQGARKTSTSTVSSSSASAPVSASASVCSLTRSTSPDLAATSAHRRHARSDATAQPQQPQQPQPQRWAVSEQASAIAGWQIDVVDHFDVRFDELVASSRSPVSMAPGPLVVARSVARDPEIHAGPYTFEPPASPGTASSGVHLGSVVSPTGTVTTLGTLTPSDQGSADEGVGTRRSGRGGHGHHRRTSSGLVGFLMRGFRSSSSSLSPTVSPRIEHGGAQQQSVALSSRGKHVRSVSNSSGADHLVRRSDAAHRQHYTHPNHSHHLHVPGSAGAEPSNSRVGEDGVIVMRPLLQQHADVDERPPPQSAGAMLQRPLRSNSAPFGDQEATEPTTRKTQTSHGVPKGPVLRRRR